MYHVYRSARYEARALLLPFAVLNLLHRIMSQRTVLCNGSYIDLFTDTSTSRPNSSIQNVPQWDPSSIIVINMFSCAASVIGYLG